MPESARSLLTPTQWLVLERLAAGERNAAIAAALGIGRPTVTSHIAAIVRRFPHVAGWEKRRAVTVWYRMVGRARHDREM